jgi:hypothetical protein
MADIWTARKALEEIPKDDALGALQKLTSLIESVRREVGFRVDFQLTLLRLIDESARPFEQKLVRDYFCAPSLCSFPKNAMDDFYLQLVYAYLNVLRRYRQWERGSSNVRSSLPLVAARGIGAVAGALKCAAARIEQIDPTVWGCVAEFYQHAEVQSYLDDPIQLYPGSGIRTSVRRKFASVVVWHVSCAGIFARPHIHLAEQLVAHMGGSFTVTEHYEGNTRFGFSLTHSTSPMRVGKEIAPRANMRLIGINDLQPQFEALFGTLRNGMVPGAIINFGGMHQLNTVHDVVRQLHRCFSPPMMKRRNERFKTKVHVSVVRDLSRILESTDANETNFSSNDGATLELEDVSADGFRYAVTVGREDRIVIGTLIGVKPARARLDCWTIGIVRRLSCDQKRTIHVGVEILSNQMTSVGLHERDANKTRTALWLDNPDTRTGNARILMAAGMYSKRRSIYAHLNGKRYLLMPAELIESNSCYDLGRYRAIKEDTTLDVAY